MAADAHVNYARATENDVNDVLNFVMDNFIGEETIGQAVGLTPTASVRQFYSDFVGPSVRSSVSFVARNSAMQVVGVRLAEISGPGDYDQKLERFFAYDFPDEPLMIMIEFMKYVFNRLDPDYTLSKAKKVLVFNLLCVHKDHRRQGIARKLSQLSIDAAKAKRCDVALVIATGFQAQSFYRKLNFEAALEVSYSEFHGAYKEQPIVPKNGSGLCQVLVRTI